MIRLYTSNDTDALVTVWQAATAQAHPFLADSFVRQEADNMRKLYLPNAETWVVVPDAVPVGFIALIGSEIGGLFVDPSHQGRGYGKALVDHAAALRGALQVEVFAANRIGRRFYQRYGFSETGRYRHDGSGEMTLQLAKA